jgi:hypothetical protein
MIKSPAVSAFVVAFASVSLYAQVHLGQVSVGSSYATPITVTIANGGKLAGLAVVTGGAEHIDFTETGGGTCKIGKAYQANDTCTVRVRFSPELAGTRLGGISLSDNNNNPMATVYITGIGRGPQTGFQPATQTTIFSNLNNVAGLTVDPSSNVYVAESATYPAEPGAPEIPGGIFKATYEGSNKYTLSDIGSLLTDPVGVAIDGDGNVLEADAILNSWINPMQGTAGSQPGFFYEEQGLAVDAAGNIYSAGSGAIYKSSPAFAATQSYAAVVTGLGTISSLAVDATGNLYIPDSGSDPAVYKETPGKDGGYVHSKIGSGWVKPTGIAVDADGVVFVNDSGTVYSETPQANGNYAQAALFTSQANGTLPAGLAVDGDGSLYVPVYQGPGPFGPSIEVEKLDRSTPPTLNFATTSAGSTSSDSPRIVTISNLGNEPLEFKSVHYPTAFPESLSGKGHCIAGTTLAAGASCTIAVDFAPLHDPNGDKSSETMTDKVEIATDSLGGPVTRQAIPVTGTKTRMPTTVTPVISRPSGTYTAGQTISLSDSTPGAIIYYTLDGKTPSETEGTRYTGPGTLEASATVKAVAYAPGYAPSSIAEASYRFVAAAPIISPAGGTYKGPVTVTITGSTPGATIFYSTGGNLPGTSSQVYTGPFVISRDDHVMAVAARTGFATSSTVGQVYTMTASPK